MARTKSAKPRLTAHERFIKQRDLLDTAALIYGLEHRRVNALWAAPVIARMTVRGLQTRVRNLQAAGKIAAVLNIRKLSRLQLQNLLDDAIYASGEGKPAAQIAYDAAVERALYDR